MTITRPLLFGLAAALVAPAWAAQDVDSSAPTWRATAQPIGLRLDSGPGGSTPQSRGSGSPAHAAAAG